MKSSNLEKLFFKDLIENILKQKILTKNKLNKLKIDIAKKYNYKKIVKNPEIIVNCKNSQRDEIIKKLNTKPVREISGVTVLALFSKPHYCPHGKCIYCPGGPNSEYGNTPQSYTGLEPAAQRAIRNNFDPYLQVFNRLEHYVINGHIPDKIEVIFMGGTFPSLDKKYKDSFVYYLYKSINDFADKFIKIVKGQKKIKWKSFIDFFELKKKLNIENKNRIKIQKKILKLKNL